MQWLDLRDARGARLRFAAREGKTYLMVFGLMSARPEWQALIDRLGYRVSARGDYLLREAAGQSLLLRDYVAIFPSAIKAEMARERVEVKVQNRGPAPQPVAASSSGNSPARPRSADGAPVERGAGVVPSGSSTEGHRETTPFARLRELSRQGPARPEAAPAGLAGSAAPAGPVPSRPVAPTTLRNQWSRRAAIDAEAVASSAPGSAAAPETATADLATGNQPSGVTPDADALSVEHDEGPARCWGRNQNGDRVFEDGFGRYFLRESDQVKVTEAELPAGPYFLRATNAEEVMRCADGFVRSMLLGEVQYQQDLERLAQAVFGTGDAAQVDVVRAAVEAAMTRALRAEFEVPHDAYDVAVQLYERLPEVRVRARGDGAMPLPVSVAAQWLLGDTRGKRVVVPNGFDGALVSVLASGSEVLAGRNLAVTPAAALEAISANVAWAAEVSADGAQALLFNADPDQADAVRANGGFSRSDYVAAVAHLERIADGARAVLVLAGDDPREPGALKGSSPAFYRWLSTTYAVDAAIETGYELQRRAGTECALRVVALTKKAPLVTAVIDQFPVVHDWDGLRNGVRNAIREHGIQEAVSEAIRVDRETEENVLQVPYQASARIGEARTMVPKNMFGALNERFAEVTALYGPVEEVVGHALNLSPAELAERYSPEQVDALALSIVRIEKEGRGIILCDETGIGKGRQIAALCGWANSLGRPVIFLTKGANLFSDLVRDQKDAQVWDRFRPFIVNADAELVDMMGDRAVVGRGTPVDELRAIVSAGSTLDELGKNIVYATYSQFNGSGSLKASWLLAQCQDALVVVDEAHEAAGASSNIANFVETLTDRAWGVVYSSATWAKTLDNISIYRRALPKQVNASTLRETMRRGGDAFMETFSAMLAREGALIRREHDLSRLTVGVRTDERRLAENERMSDQISEVLGAMAYVAGETNRLFTRMNSGANALLERARSQRVEIVSALSRGRGVAAETAIDRAAEQVEIRRILGTMRVARLQFNLGTNLYQTIRRVEAAMTAQFGADLAIEALRAGRKPGIVFEDTNEVLVKRMMDDARRAVVEQAHRNGVVLERAPKVSEIETPNIKHMLRSLARSLGVVSWVSAADLLSAPAPGVASGEGSTDVGGAAGAGVQFIDEVEGLPGNFVESYREGMQRIMEAIDALPDMPIIAADIVRNRLEAEGYVVGEISGRASTTKEIALGRSRVVARNNSKKAVNGTVNAFNDGEVDVVLINRAGSAGLSLHASPRFRDTRQRELIELQIPSNVTDRIQLFGRFNRYDQVSSPIITGASSGLFASLRLLMMQNNKLRTLSANTRSSRNNAFEDTRIPDLLNSVGRDAALEFLRDNPGMMVRLGLDASILDEQNESRYDFADMVMKRVPLLRVAEQRRVYEELMGRFDDILMRAEMRGENPLRAQEIAGVVRQGPKRILAGIEIPGQSIFDSPVYVSTIEWEQDVQPLRWADIIEQVKAGRERLVEQGHADFDNAYAEAVSAGGLDMSAYATRVKQMFDAMTRIALQATQYETVEAALEGRGLNPVKRAAERGRWFEDVAMRLLPGASFALSDLGAGEPQSFVVLGWTLPASNREINFEQYRIQMVAAGEARPSEMSLAAIFNYWGTVAVVVPDVFDPRAEALVCASLREAFNQAPSGRVSYSRTVLDGNLYAASELAVQNKLGSGVLFTDVNGVKRRAIQLKKSLTEFGLQQLPRAITRVELLVRLAHKIEQEGGDPMTPFHMSLHDAMKREGLEVLYFVHRDGVFHWQLHMERSELKRLRDKLRLAGHEGLLDGAVPVKAAGRGRVMLHSAQIGALPVVLEGRGIETVYLSRGSLASTNQHLDTVEAIYRDEQIAVRERLLAQREAALRAEHEANEHYPAPGEAGRHAA